VKISYSWLRDYVDIDLAPVELADKMTLVGLEVDDVEIVDFTLEGVVVGRVLDVRRHPNADRLVLCDVDHGSGEIVQIVCGAPNVAAGQLVPVALPGTTLHLPGRDDPSVKVPVKIKPSKIRGEASSGMVCAEDELGLSEDHSGIMVLDESAVPGMPFSEYLSRQGVTIQEAVFDIELTPNRPDATSHVGVAREVAAALDTELRLPDVPGLDEPARKSDGSAGKLDIRIDNPDGCGRYVGILVEGVTIAESPDWLKARLEAVGLRPRNNVVDITNFVMFELGQPLHAFDFDNLAGGAIVVRDAEQGEAFVTLDDVERTLNSDMLMICDGDRPVAVAGVMGGQNSEVTDETKNILIESAWFEPASVRKTARALNLQTDASYRFERGVDPGGTRVAAQRAANLVAEFGGGRIVETVDEHPRPQEPKIVELRPARVETILGVAVSTPEIVDLLGRIGFETKADGEVLRCTVPTFRPDVEREIDLVEEVARLYGFDRIPVPSSTRIPYTAPDSTPDERLRGQTLTYLAGLGFREVYTNSLLPPVIAETVETLLDPDGEHVSTFNAINHHMSALRPSLLPGVLRVAAHNRNHGQKIIRLAEFGHVFHRGKMEGETRPSWVDGYVEREALIMAVAGPAVSGSWDREESLSDLFDLKGMLRSLMSYLDVSGLKVVASKSPHVVMRKALDVILDDRVIGAAGQLNPVASRAYDLEADLFFVELFWSPVANAARLGSPKPYSEISRFPTVTRDLAVVFDSKVLVGDLVDTIRVAAGPLLVDAGVFDVYEGEGIDKGKRSVGFKLQFGANRTLVDDEVDRAMQSVVEVLSVDWKAELRT
jgi:phenylalanyl-tRNA synthetase beta chain